jgi:hypothetical protein
MNSDKAAAVRDSIKGCPGIVDADDTSEYPSDRLESTELGNDVVYTGEYLRPNAHFRPPTVEQSGTLGDGNGATRPVYVVTLEPLWTADHRILSLSPEIVYEVAKHECRVRVYPEDYRLGPAVWVVDHFTEDLSNTDGERCPECEATYWKVRDGEPECARCGTPLHREESTAEPTLGDYA